MGFEPYVAATRRESTLSISGLCGRSPFAIASFAQSQIRQFVKSRSSLLTSAAVSSRVAMCRSQMGALGFEVRNGTVGGVDLTFAIDPARCAHEANIKSELHWRLGCRWSFNSHIRKKGCGNSMRMLELNH
jgi:hypothetical protein